MKSSRTGGLQALGPRETRPLMDRAEKELCAEPWTGPRTETDNRHSAPTALAGGHPIGARRSVPATDGISWLCPRTADGEQASLL